jgi:dihydrodipicolinate reductase
MHHLSKLDAIAGTLVEVKDTLLDAATGRHQIPLEIVKELFAQTRKDVGTNTKILAGVIVLLLAVIGFLLMGEHFGWIRTLANP